MGQRNIEFSNYLERDQFQFQPESPSVRFGGVTGYPQADIIQLPAPGNTTSFDFHHHLPEQRLHGMMRPYAPGIQHQHHLRATNLDLNYCNHPVYMTPSGTRIFPIPISHGYHGIAGVGVSRNDYSGNNHGMDGFRSLSKRSNVYGVYVEAEGTAVLGYREGPTGNGISTNFSHHHPIHQGPHLHHAAPQPMQGARSHYTRQGYVGPVPPSFRINQPRQASSHSSLLQLTIQPTEEIAMLDVSSYYEGGNFRDQHREMRLDIDHMSYEELLALGDRIGKVRIGLSEETIISHLKTRIYTPPTSFASLEEEEQEETDCCVVCQSEYTEQEKIATLGCGHEYHVDCIKKWLLVKNACPICKSTVINDQ